MTRIPPPWIAYRGASPTWSGWRQGESEAWLLETWLPMWHRMQDAERRAYLAQWPAPDDDWARQIAIWSPP